jgi:hypothetical protein
LQRGEGNKIDSLEHLAQRFPPSRPNKQCFPVIVFIFELSENDPRFGGRRNSLFVQYSRFQPPSAVARAAVFIRSQFCLALPA